MDLYNNLNAHSSPNVSNPKKTQEQRTSSPSASIVINIPTSNSFDSLCTENDDDDTPLDLTSGHIRNRSCPAITQNNQEEITMLKNTIEALQKQLASADMDIEKKLNENCKLKEIIKQKDLALNRLKSQCKEKIPVKTSQEKKTEQKKQPKATCLNADTESNDNIGVDNGIISDSEDNAELFNNKIHIDTNSKRKIHIFSTNKKNNVLTIAERHFKNTSLCHFIYPGSGIRHQLDSVLPKIADFTTNDFCIILLGDQDFYSSKDYNELVSNIRQTLLEMQHTNILICIPSFKLNKQSTMFNSRIELFNKILCEDNLKFQYAYLIDTNSNLEYDRRHFNLKTGSINNSGMDIVFRTAHEKVNTIEQWYLGSDCCAFNSTMLNSENVGEQSFFRS
ncbi:hypothetical protein NE865_11692 [Phthorimaea operculella]|nr:hypothetical protein NE865_11692 [Phthorimaea operculella]